MSEAGSRPLALTMGDPAGIGGEVALKAWQALRRTGDAAAFVYLGAADPLRDLAAKLGLAAEIRTVSAPAEAPGIFAEALPVLPVATAAPVRPGAPDPANAPAVLRSIERAVALARGGEVGGVVTNPINKAVLYEHGFRHPGHTEFLADLCGIETPPAMMLVSEQLRVVPVTIHLALAEAIRSLTSEAIVACGRVTAAGLVSDFGVTAPRLAVAGLNPHAGEAGHMGREEIEIIAPAVAALRAEGIAVSDAAPADTLFHERARQGYDAVLCMHHDQALIPLKTLDFDGGVNVTLGLPIVRASPDHGTAFDIAGRGIARPDSLIASLRLAARMAVTRARTAPRPSGALA